MVIPISDGVRKSLGTMLDPVPLALNNIERAQADLMEGILRAKTPSEALRIMEGISRAVLMLEAIKSSALDRADRLCGPPSVWHGGEQ